MNVLDLLEEARQHRLTLYVDESQKLKINLPAGEQPPSEFIQRIKAYKTEIINFLIENSATVQKENKIQIPRINRDHFDQIPLTYAQKAIWFIDEMEGSTSYHIPLSLTLADHVTTELLRSAYEQVIHNHESLQSVIKATKGVPYQSVVSRKSWPLESVAFETDVSAYQAYVQKKLMEPFDLKEGPLIRAYHVQYNDCQKLLIVVHHIVFDGWSGALFLKELDDCFRGEASQSRKEAPIDYYDFAVWQSEKFQDEKDQAPLNFWKEKLDGFEAAILPTDFQRPPISTQAGKTLSISLTDELSKTLGLFAIEEKTSLYVLMVSVFNLLLYKYTNESDLTIGTPIANRQPIELEPVVGFFTNTLLLRTEVKPEMEFRVWLASCSVKIMEALSYGDVPLVKVAESIQEERNESAELFNIMFSFANYPEAKDLEVGMEDDLGFLPTSQFDLSTEVEEKDGKIRVLFNYSTDLFLEETIKRFADHYTTLLAEISADPDLPLKEYTMITPEEQRTIETFSNQEVVKSDGELTVIDLFERSVKTFPSHTALSHGEVNLTYAELCEKSNQWSHLLTAKGVTPGSLVAVSLDRSIDMVVILFGVLKAGAAYVPIDPAIPENRKSYILEHTEAKFIITDQEEQLSHKTVKLIHKDLVASELPSFDPKHCSSCPNPSDLAYVIYTSGSTGVPKGVMVNHSSLTLMSQHMHLLYPVQADGRFLLKTNFMFDVSCAELYGWFHAGGCLVVLPQGLESDAQSLVRTIADQCVSHINFVPSMLEVFLKEATEDLSSLKYIFSAGEALSKKLITTFNRSGLDTSLINLYGPTEATVYATGYDTKDYAGGNEVPIGKPLPHVKALILDEYQKMVPVGVAGELYLGGGALSQGYLKDKKQTQARFINHSKAKGERIYRTGDAVKWSAEGDILYLGRLDDQVKFRGYRVELGEISYHLNQYKEVDLAVTLIQTIDDAQYLVAYYSGDKIDDAELKAYLEASLPGYMIPTYFVHLQSFPRLPSGKINKKALPVPEKIQESEYVAATDEIEQKLVDIWSELLQIPEDKVSVTMNFFRNGGHSLMATRMISLIQQELVVNFPVRTIFQYPSIRDLAKYIRVVSQPVEPTENYDTIEL